MPDYNKIKRKFEKEVWLYISGELSDEKMKFWDTTLASFPELRREYEEYQEFENFSKETLSEELPDIKLDILLENVSAKKGLKTSAVDFIRKLFVTDDFAVKFSFVTAITVVALIIFFQSVTFERTQQELYEWNDSVTNERISQLGNSIQSLLGENITKSSITDEELELLKLRMEYLQEIDNYNSPGQEKNIKINDNGEKYETVN